MPCSDGGMLIIKVGKENDYLKLTIEDNGIGRAKSEGKSASTGTRVEVWVPVVVSRFIEHPFF